MPKIIAEVTVNKYSLSQFALEFSNLVESNNGEYKRRKIGDGSRVSATSESPHSYSLTFIAPVSDVDRELSRQFFPALFHRKDQNLVASWNYTNFGGSVLASMSISSNLAANSIVKHECTNLNYNFQEDATTTIEGEEHLFISIAYAIKEGLLDVSNVRITPPSEEDTRELMVNMDLYYSTKPEHKPEANSLVIAISRSVHIKKHNQPLQQAVLEPKAIASSSKDTTESSSETQASFKKQTVPQQQNLTSAHAKMPTIQAVTASEAQVSHNALSQLLTTPSVGSSKSESPNPKPISGSIKELYQYLQPPVSENILHQYTSPDVETTLSPFQTQNIEWMVSREGHFANADGIIHPNLEIYDGLPLLYADSHHDGAENHGYCNILNGKTETDISVIKDLIQDSYSGGLLADEAGLGKTVSVLGLISKHKYNPNDLYHPQKKDHSELAFTKATLIVTHKSIIKQWQCEIEKHTPSLKTLVYYGFKGCHNIFCEDFDQFDIVLTSYEFFKSETRFNVPCPKRPRRLGAKYKMVLRSPFVNTLWFRCVLDEAQMVDTPSTNIPSIIESIPSWYSWAVTSAPLKEGFADLFVLYNFLNLERSFDELSFTSFCNDPRRRETFYNFMKTTARRNTKIALKDQVSIPKQNQHVVKIPFSIFEKFNYDSIWSDYRQELNSDWFDSINWTLPPDADEVMVAKYNHCKRRMRPLLFHIRKLCVLGMEECNTETSNNNYTQTFDEALKEMAEEAKDTLNDHLFSLYENHWKVGFCYELAKDWNGATKAYEKHITAVEEIVDKLEAPVEDLETEYGDTMSPRQTCPKPFNTLYKWKLLNHQYCARLDYIYRLLKLKDPQDDFYSKEPNLFRFLLKEIRTRVDMATEKVQKTSDILESLDYVKIGIREFDSSFLDELDYEDGEEPDEGEVTSTIECMKYLGDILDRQYERILSLRNKAIPMLTKSLAENGEGLTGEVDNWWEDRLAEEETCRIYLSAYQALLNDRIFLLDDSLDGTSYAVLESQEERTSEEDALIEATEKLFKQSLTYSRSLKPTCLKVAEFSLQEIKDKIAKEWRLKKALELLNDEHEHFTSMVFPQTKLLKNLGADLEALTTLFEERRLFYIFHRIRSRNMMERETEDILNTIAKHQACIVELETAIEHCTSRDRYFTALLEENRSANNGEVACFICQEPIEKGVVTFCGHTSCSSCGLDWFKSHKKCHSCDKLVDTNEWYNVSYKQIEMQDKEEVDTGHSQEETLSLITEINKEIIDGGKGAKVDSIIRHIQYIKNTTNGKCIIYSEWEKTLSLIMQSLDENNVAYTTIEKAQMFRRNPYINVILLQPRSQFSGLTLVEAHTVFIVEPLINESLEEQVINSVHRIGQTNETNIFRYIIQDTVEERIQEIYDWKRINRVENDSTANAKKEKLPKQPNDDDQGEYIDFEDLRRCFTSSTMEF